MADKQGVDPRFDPRFQRGGDPGAARLAPPAGSAKSSAAPAAPVAKSAAPPAAAPAHSVTQEPAAERTPARTPKVSAPNPDDAEPLRGINPFRLALLALSIASLAAAAWLTWLGYDSLLFQYGGGTDRWMQFLSQLISLLPSGLVIAGLIGFVLWLGLGIVAPRREREGDHE